MQVESDITKHMLSTVPETASLNCAASNGVSTLNMLFPICVRKIRTTDYNKFF